MIEATEVNSTFYALRLLSHGLDTSQIEVTDGEEYPASEFTREEQEQARKIIRGIEDSESASVKQLSPKKIAFYLTSLVDQIEELANSDLADASHNLQHPTTPFFQGAPLVLEPTTPPEVALHLESLTHGLAELDPQLRRLFELRYLQGYTFEEIAEVMNISGPTVRIRLAWALRRLREGLTKRDLKQEAE